MSVTSSLPLAHQTRPWEQLQTHFQKKMSRFDIRAAFAQDTQRVLKHSVQAPHVFADLSKNHVDDTTLALLLELAQERGVATQRDAMFAGEMINQSEARAVGHVRLRDPNDETVMPVLNAFLAFAENIRANDGLTDIVNIGIGGSDLGPRFVVEALEQFRQTNKRFHFVSNVDGHELQQTLQKLNAKNTLFVIASKTFTTLETMRNAASSKAWFLASGMLEADIAKHFCAVTSNVKGAKDFGIETSFGFWDWVGGRYSLWSSIGLSIAISIGESGFRSLLSGAREMDKHFEQTALAHNLPVRLALLDVWQRNFLGYTSRCVAPYAQALARLPAYLQQLEMESNGKSVDQSGLALPFATAPVVWGESGTNLQHTFFQMVHQGPDPLPVEFLLIKNSSYDAPYARMHQSQLLVNAVAQAQALMQGALDVGGHKNFAGNRPSNFLVLNELTPQSLGSLIALYEHRVFVSGVIWGINSFDQFGVELGKVLAKDIAQRFVTGDVQGVDASTAQLIEKLR